MDDWEFAALMDGTNKAFVEVGGNAVLLDPALLSVMPLLVLGTGSGGGDTDGLVVAGTGDEAWKMKKRLNKKSIWKYKSHKSHDRSIDLTKIQSINQSINQSIGRTYQDLVSRHWVWIRLRDC